MRGENRTPDAVMGVTQKWVQKKKDLFLHPVTFEFEIWISNELLESRFRSVEIIFLLIASQAQRSAL